MAKTSNTQTTEPITPEIVKAIAESDPIAIIDSAESNPNQSSSNYTSFGSRFWASVIDNFIILILGAIIVIVSLIVFASSYTSETYLETIRVCQNTRIAQNSALCRDFFDNFGRYFYGSTISVIILAVAYRIIMPRTFWRGTIGKRAMKILIVDENNLRISWLQSFARESFGILLLIVWTLSSFLPQINTLIPLIGIAIIQNGLQVLWSTRKQSTEDTIARTFVIKN
jgi:uncharacterized RDD family membrane protein YckC